MPVCFLTAVLLWRRQRWLAATGAAVATFLMLGLPTAVVPNPLFGRSIPPTDWSMAVLAMTSVLSGLLFATYVRNDPGLDEPVAADRPAAGGALGGVLSFLAIGCPVCNKLALLALGSTGAVQFFAPVQPYLAVAGVALLGLALAVRLRGEAVCTLPPQPSKSRAAGPGASVTEPQGAESPSLEVRR